KLPFRYVGQAVAGCCAAKDGFGVSRTAVFKGSVCVGEGKGVWVVKTPAFDLTEVGTDEELKTLCVYATDVFGSSTTGGDAFGYDEVFQLGVEENELAKVFAVVVVAEADLDGVAGFFVDAVVAVTGA